MFQSVRSRRRVALTSNNPNSHFGIEPEAHISHLLDTFRADFLDPIRWVTDTEAAGEEEEQEEIEVEAAERDEAVAVWRAEEEEEEGAEVGG